MIIIIPLGGRGTRFKNEDFVKPKALIKVLDKEIIFHLIDNLVLNETIEQVYIPYHRDYIKYNFEYLIKTRYPNYKFIFYPLEEDTKGAAETIYITLKKIEKDSPVLCIDSDNFYTTDIVSKWSGENKIFTFKSLDIESRFSYIKYDCENNITKIVEKHKISDVACCGAYGFSSSLKLKNYCQTLIRENVRQKGEFFTSGVVSKMISENINFKNELLDNKDYFSLGTPEQVKMFEKTFLLDLDGTLVDSDPLYKEVWNKILEKYNLNCDENFFTHFIRGKSDTDFLNYIFGNNINYQEISREKDNLFDSILEKKDILYPGVQNFFDTIQNSKIAIVTSCNKKSAFSVLNKYELNKYINLIISSEDVENHKPSPGPYLKSLEILDRKIDNCIVLEDSYTGYTSAVRAKIPKIFIYNNGKNKDLIKKVNTNIFDDYLLLNEKIFFDSDDINCLSSNIKDSLVENFQVEKVSKGVNKNLKTGYICDIERYVITLKNKEKIKVILKLSNTGNELSKVANELDMYHKENFFYKNISHLHHFRVPKYYGSLKKNDRIGIILEELELNSGSFGIDLNNNTDILMNVVREISQIHSCYYFEGKENLFENMKNLKTMKDIKYYHEFINKRFHKFIEKNKTILTKDELIILNKIFNNFGEYCNKSSQFPLSFCHGDLKSPNIYYKNNSEPYLLDWQYIHLNKGINDITFLLVESLNFEERKVKLVLDYYYFKMKEKIQDFCYEEMFQDFKNSLCIFPFFVMVWFNSEDPEKLIDNIFPIRFMKNTLKYYNYFL